MPLRFAFSYKALSALDPFDALAVLDFEEPHELLLLVLLLLDLLLLLLLLDLDLLGVLVRGRLPLLRERCAYTSPTENMANMAIANAQTLRRFQIPVISFLSA